MSFSVDMGKIYGFLGPNGSGKTTVMKMVAGLLNPSTGEILINNEKISTTYQRNNRLHVNRELHISTYENKYCWKILSGFFIQILTWKDIKNLLISWILQ